MRGELIKMCIEFGVELFRYVLSKQAAQRPTGDDDGDDDPDQRTEQQAQAQRAAQFHRLGVCAEELHAATRR